VNYDGSVFVPLIGGGPSLWRYDGSSWASVSNLSYVGAVGLVGPNEAWVLARDASQSKLGAPQGVAHVQDGVATTRLTASSGDIWSELAVNSPTDSWISGEALPGGLGASAQAGGAPL
jgi:hypothetical protein